MIVYTLLAITLFSAFYSLYGLWKGGRLSLNAGWHRLLVALSLGAVVYLYGTWVFLTVYLKYVFGIALLVLLAIGLARRKRLSSNKSHPVRAFINVIGTLVFSALAILYFTGTTGKADKAELAFPLKTGKYFILQGGKGLPTNLFHYSYRGAIYAIDIVKLNKTGNRASTIFSKKLEDYGIFNDTVFAPCDGIVVRAENDNPDNIPPSRKRGPTNTNMVTLETDGYYVFMAHFKQGSVMVQAGDKVKQGQPLALAGNSGFTLEPHLHIQAHKNTHTGLPWYSEEPLLISFDGRTYLMFETISPKRVDMQ
ncbi:MAG: M23 family metallopeptidase [Sphingobacteriales bacterium]|nr:MAG: M23 family metallopeptidase [Sphingobacteriales bacterium]